MAITLPNDIRPVIKSYSGKKLSDAFIEHQNILREKFNEQNKDILRKREEKKLNIHSGNNFFIHKYNLIFILNKLYIVDIFFFFFFFFF